MAKKQQQQLQLYPSWEVHKANTAGLIKREVSC